jgi:hypothetical protein
MRVRALLRTPPAVEWYSVMQHASTLYMQSQTIHRPAFLFRLTLPLASVLVGCTAGDVFQPAFRASADSASRAYLSLIIAGRTDSAARLIVVPAGAPDPPRSIFQELTTLLRGATLDSARVVGAHTFSVAFPNGETRRRARMSYEMRSISGWRLATVSIVDTAGVLRIEGINVDTLAAPLAELNAFALSRKSPRHYLWFLAALAAVATCVTSAVLVATARGMPRRWLWVVLSLFGVTKFSLDWTTGAIGVMPIAVQFLGAGFQRAVPVGPWIVSFSLPLFAVIALSRRRRWVRAHGSVRLDSDASAA